MSPESNVLLTAHEIAVQNVHISMEYPCSVRIDVYCQKLGHFKLENYCVGARGSAASRCRGARGETGDAHAGSRGEGLTRVGQ